MAGRGVRGLPGEEVVTGRSEFRSRGWADRRAVVVGVSLLPVFLVVSLARE
jgi:hypothetical protein